MNQLKLAKGSSAATTEIIKNLSIAFILAIALWLAIPDTAFTQANQNTSGYVSVNNLDYYYEVHGENTEKEPLLLLHGGLGSFEMFNPVLSELTKDRQVIGIDLHGHGRTTLGDRPISYIDMGNDLAGILDQLGYDKVDMLGYSMGGGVAFRFAVQHPNLIRKLVIVSGSFSREGFYPGILQQQEQVSAEMAGTMKGTPMFKSYQALAPNPEDFPKLLDQMGQLMAQPYDWSEDVKKLEMPVMLIYGDSDMFRPEHIVEFYQLLGGGQRDAGWQREHMPQNRLAILPNLTHYEIFMAPEMIETSLAFFDGESGPENWGKQEKGSSTGEN